MEKAAGSVAETQAPVTNLIRHKTAKELVDPEIIEAILHTRHDITSRFFLFTLLRRIPMNRPANENDTLNAGPDRSPYIPKS